MDIDDYVFQKRKKDPTYTYKKLAKELGISSNYLQNIRKKRVLPNARFCIRLSEVTNGQVDPMEIMKEIYNKINPDDIT